VRSQQAPEVSSEVRLLNEAERSLRQGDASGALRRVQEHRAAFPRSTLDQEREAIAIEALVRLGHPERARRRFDRWARRYPESSYRWRLEAMLGGPSDAR